MRQVRFTQVLRAVAVRVDVEFARESRRQVEAIGAAIGAGSSNGSGDGWIIAFSLRVARWVIRIGFVDVRTCAARWNGRRPHTVAVGGHRLHVVENICDENIHVRQVRFTQVLRAVAVRVDVEFAGQGRRQVVAIGSGIRVLTAHGEHIARITAFGLGITRGILRVGFVHLHRGCSGSNVSGPVTSAIGDNHLHTTQSIGHNHILIGQSIFSDILLPIAIGIDVNSA